MDNASQIVADGLSAVGLVLDVSAGAIDVVATGIVATAVITGATAGAAITIPGGGTVVVGGAAGAAAGWAAGEIGVQGMIFAGNILATGATLATVTSETVSGKNQLNIKLKMTRDEIVYNAQTTIGPGTQVSALATAGGWMAPLSFLSLGFQTVAVAGDLGFISPPPLQASTYSRISIKERSIIE